MIKLTEELSRKIDRWIQEHQDALVDETCRLVRIPSVADEALAQPNAPFGPGCREALNTYFEIAKAHGLSVRDREGYIGEAFVPEWAGKKKRVALLGHLDVVPADGDWLYPAFGGVVKDGEIIGRGSQDNKGPCLAALYTVLCLRDLGIDLEYEVLALAGTEEECGMKDAIYYAKQPDVPDLIVVTDSGFPICFGERGIVGGELRSNLPVSGEILAIRAGTASNMIPDNAEITLRKSPELLAKLQALPECKDCGWREEGDGLVVWGKGVGGHLSFGDGMRNAIGVLLNYLLDNDLLLSQSDRALFLFAAKAAASSDGAAVGIACEDEMSGSMKFGCGVLKLEDGHLLLSFSARCPVSANGEEVAAKITAAGEQNGFAVDHLRILEANYFPRESAVVSTLSSVFKQETGLNWEPQVFAAGTHARKLPNAVAFGPGGLVGTCTPNLSQLPKGHGGAHQPDEAQSIAALCKALKVYIMGVIALDGKPLGKNDLA